MSTFFLIITLIIGGQLPVQVLVPTGSSLEGCKAAASEVLIRMQVPGTITNASTSCEDVKGI
jgi:hypothetical protein